nr:hypothetical protein [Orientia tsutsugamushi]
MMLRIRHAKATTCLAELNFSIFAKQAKTIAYVFAPTSGIDASNADFIEKIFVIFNMIIKFKQILKINKLLLIT